MECEFCKRVLKNTSSMNNHLKSAKYCLKIRGEIKKGKFLCKFCSKDFHQKIHLHNHTLVCNTQQYTSKLEKENKLLQLHVDILRDERDKLLKEKEDNWEKYEKLALTIAKNPPTNKTIINNTLNLSVFNKSDEDIKKIVDEHYNRNYVTEGQRGVARFTHSHVINQSDGEDPVYTITDKSRGNGKYKTSENEVVTDAGMKGLTNKIYPSIKKKAVEIAIADSNPFDDKMFADGLSEVCNLGDDNSTFRNEMVRLSSPPPLDDAIEVIEEID